MIDRIIAKLPEAWRGLAELIPGPIAWVPVLQQMMMSFFFEAQGGWIAATKYIFLLFPVFLGVVAVWSTTLALYTLPFRAGRTRFVSLILLAWWDAALSVWLYWVGMVRVAAVILGWVFGLSRLLAKLVVGFVRDIVGIPFAMSGMLMRGYLKPGVPWLPFVMLIFWCVLEAAVFTYTLEPRVALLVTDLTGADDSRFTIPVLYMLVLTLLVALVEDFCLAPPRSFYVRVRSLLVAGFGCVGARAPPVRKRDSKFLAQIL